MRPLRGARVLCSTTTPWGREQLPGHVCAPRRSLGAAVLAENAPGTRERQDAHSDVGEYNHPAPQRMTTSPWGRVSLSVCE